MLAGVFLCENLCRLNPGLLYKVVVLSSFIFYDSLVLALTRTSSPFDSRDRTRVCALVLWARGVFV